MQKEPIRMKSSSSDSNKETIQGNLIPQFASAIYIEKGEEKITYRIIGGFPKTEILPGLLRMAKKVKAELIDHIAPGAEQEEAMEALEELVEDAENDETVAHKAKVLTLDTKPTEVEG